MSQDGFFQGKTFDDFLFRPQKGVSQSRRQISLSSPLTSRLRLELPIVSANMNSVTGARMAMAMALEGGIGIVHRGSSIERQQARVAHFRRALRHRAR